MTDRYEVSFLDRKEILETVFPVAYAPFRLYGQEAVPDAAEFKVTAAPGITLQCGFWVHSPTAPVILYFHGNGETASDYHHEADFYHTIGVNLFVAEYRGYGKSDGLPTISNLMEDCHSIFNALTTHLADTGFHSPLFVMGRSLGSIPAVELAWRHQSELSGLIIESGTANNLSRIWEHISGEQVQSLIDQNFLNRQKIAASTIPLLLIHGECDSIIPVSEAWELYHNSASPEKELFIVPGKNHNNLLLEWETYFAKISEFIARHTA